MTQYFEAIVLDQKHETKIRIENARNLYEARIGAREKGLCPIAFDVVVNGVLVQRADERHRQ